MDVLKNLSCLNCGGEVTLSEDGREATCKYCRRIYRIGSTLKDGALISFAFATEYLKSFRFADAKRKFSEVTDENPEFSEAWWGAFIAEYGIEFGRNRLGETVPTCHRAHTVKVSDDPSYKRAIETADEKARKEYISLGEKIEYVRSEIIEKAENGEIYDVFICFKATETDSGRKTEDYYLGRDIYHELKDEGYNVFFSAETLKRIGEQEFEPYIFRALSTARVMLVLCSDNEKLESAWVKNEWSRFLDMKGGKGLIPVCGNNAERYSPYELPEELRRLNAIEFGGNLFEDLKTKIEAYFPERVKARTEAEKKAREAEYEARFAKEREELLRKQQEQIEALKKQMQGFAVTPKEESRAPERTKPQEESKKPENTKPEEESRAPERTKPAYTKNGKKISFGEYPQTKVTDSGLISTLMGLAGSLPVAGNSRKWTSYGYYIEGKVKDYMWYIDVESGGERYRGVYFTSYRPSFCDDESNEDNLRQVDNGYTVNNVYWFKFEPIQWTALSETGGNALILCDMIIDSQQYDYDEEGRSNNYKESTIRAWLNDNFYNTAFTDLQKAIILTTEVDNSVSSTGYEENEYACENTNDKVFLLSVSEVTNSDYGFNGDPEEEDVVRQKKTTDYVQSQGGYEGNVFWWLRSPSDGSSSSARGVSRGGDVYSSLVRNSSLGVVPALQIRL